MNDLFKTNKDRRSILEQWEITEQQLSELVSQNPSLRGIMLGYIAEKKFHDMFLNHPEISGVRKDDDHDRSRKGDRRINYKGHTLVVEVKSLQTNTVKKTNKNTWAGKAQVDGSDRRFIKFKDGSELNTTLLKRGEFDLLAVNCFAFGEEWRFAFAKNKDLPCSNFKKYTEEQRSQLIASLIPVQWPPQPPFTIDFIQLLDEIVDDRNS